MSILSELLKQMNVTEGFDFDRKFVYKKNEMIVVVYQPKESKVKEIRIDAGMTTSKFYILSKQEAERRIKDYMSNPEWIEEPLEDRL